MLRHGGRMIFTTIEAMPELSPADRRRAANTGPPAVLTRSSYSSLLRSAGFDDIAHTDITTEYRSTQQAWNDVQQGRSSVFGLEMSPEAVEQNLAARRAALAAIDAGLLRRSQYAATRP